MNHKGMLETIKLVLKERGQISSNQAAYLIDRVEKLTAALESIASEHITGADRPEYWLESSHEECATTNAIDTQIARKALNGEVEK